jgi:YHS domain-containing protein
MIGNREMRQEQAEQQSRGELMGSTIYFCAAGYKTAFDQCPVLYLNKMAS